MTASGHTCASCDAALAPDQRYCLQCGRRRGEPRLPFMDAVVFMEAASQPAPAPAAPAAARERRPRLSPSASMIAGVATLILAIGVGVLIGQAGHEAAQTASATPQIIRVGGGAAAEPAASAASPGSEGGKDKGGKAKPRKAPENAIDGSGTSEAAAEVLKPAGDVKLPPPTVQPGGKCQSDTAGCEGGKFDGSFFGE